MVAAGGLVHQAAWDLLLLLLGVPGPKCLPLGPETPCASDEQRVAVQAQAEASSRQGVRRDGRKQTAAQVTQHVKQHALVATAR